MEENLEKYLKNIPKEDIKLLRESYKKIINNKMKLLKDLVIKIEGSNYDEHIKGLFKETINTTLLVFSTIKKGDCINSLNLIRKSYESILTINIYYYGELDINKEITVADKRDFYIENTLKILNKDNKVDEFIFNRNKDMAKQLFISTYSFLCDFVHAKAIIIKYYEIQSNKKTNRIFKDIVYINLLGIVENIEGLYNQMSNIKDNDISIIELFIGISITIINYSKLSKKSKGILKEFYYEYSNRIKNDKKMEGFSKNAEEYSKFLKYIFDEFKNSMRTENKEK